MEKQELFFTGDQVINFDDLGQFKDYTQDIQNMIFNLKNVIENKSDLNTQLLSQIFKADSEDTFHLPVFKELISLIMSVLKQKPKAIQMSNVYKQTLQNIFAVLQQSFLSFSFCEDIGPQIVEYIKTKQIKESIDTIELSYILNFLLKMSDKGNYIDNYQLFSDIILTINENDFFKNKNLQQQKIKSFVAVYFFALERILRNSKIRKCLREKMANFQKQKLTYLNFKLFLWQKANKQQIEAILQHLESTKISQFDLTKQLISYWKKIINSNL